MLRFARNDGALVSRGSALVSHTTSSSPRGALEALLLAPAQRGRGECRMPNAPAASCAIVVIERTRVTTSTPESPGIPARNGFNGFLRNRPAIPSRQNAAASTASHPASVTIMIRPNPSGEIVMGGQPFFNMRTSYTRFCGKRMARARILQNLDSRNFALCEKKSEVQCDSLQRRRKKVTKHDQ